MPQTPVLKGKLRKRGSKTGAGLPAIVRAASDHSSSNGVATPRSDTAATLAPDLNQRHPKTSVAARVYIGDCREIIPRIPECRAGTVDLIFADPPFNWKRAYDEWDDGLPHNEYLDFTYKWLDLCVEALRPGGALWVNIPDDWAAEIVMHLKYQQLDGKYLTAAPARMTMVNWCIWHYRFGQNTTVRFINSKVHAFYFVKPGGDAVWNPHEVLEESDRRAIYADARTEDKNDGMPAGMRVPMDVWYGKFWGRVQGNSKERRGYHDNQLPELYLARVVRACSNPGDLVMDPFLGSGTTGVVAHELGRNFIGCEYSAKNAASSLERIKAGPVRDVHGMGQSTAIFPHRRKGEAAAAGLEEEDPNEAVLFDLPGKPAEPGAKKPSVKKPRGRKPAKS